MRDYLVVTHRQPNLPTLELMITLCAAYHAFVRRLGTLCTLLPPERSPDFQTMVHGILASMAVLKLSHDN